MWPRLMAKPALTALCLALIAGGGGDDEPAGGPQTDLPAAGGGGSLSWALPSLPASLDPLQADGREARLIGRQVYEPLVATATPPYEGAPRPAGLALSLKPSPDRTVWKVSLRDGVRFQDGEPFNAAAVLANSRRWLSLPAGRELLPSLFAVDAPRPNEVRFQFERPLPDLASPLASPRLAIVSPQALQPSSGERARFRDEAAGSGTGPFELGARSESRLELSRHALWWGSPLGLGPALDASAFIAAGDEAARLELLLSGEVQVAQPLEGAALEEVESDPLLRAASGAGVPTGVEASVRGLESGSLPLLSGIWLTDIARG